MPHSQIKNIAVADEQRADRRSSDRQKLVLRVGLLERDGRAIFCLVKNISSTGVQVKPYGRLCIGAAVSLRVGDEDAVAGSVVWSRDGLVGIEFSTALNPQALLRLAQKMVGRRRRAAPRVNTDLRACIRTGGRRYSATLCDLSMLGARVRTSKPITFAGPIIFEVPGLPNMTAFLRWEDGLECGLSFEAPLPIQLITELLSENRAGSPPSIQLPA